MKTDKNVRHVYFEVSNGEVIAPYTVLPAYYAIVCGSVLPKIIEIKACFSQANIDRSGELWALKQVLEERQAWNNYKWLLPSLVKYLRTIMFQTFDDYESQLSPNFVYVPIGLNNP